MSNRAITPTLYLHCFSTCKFKNFKAKDMNFTLTSSNPIGHPSMACCPTDASKARVGEELLIWPQTGNPSELFKVTSGQSLFAIVNRRCVEDPQSRASDLTSSSLTGLDIASKRDIIWIALANLIRLHWKRASKPNYGLMLTSPLRHVHGTGEKSNNEHNANAPSLRSQGLRLAIMASERLLNLQPHNWVSRRNHGMMLYYSRDYGKAVQELSICMAFAPEDVAEILEPFVDKLHLLRLESTWTSLGHAGHLAVS